MHFESNKIATLILIDEFDDRLGVMFNNFADIRKHEIKIFQKALIYHLNEVTSLKKWDFTGIIW